MISEPELIGEDGEIVRVLPADVVEPPPPPARPAGRRPWLWALGGALVASAVWAGTLHELGDGPPTDLRGYELPEDLCTVAEVSALVGKFGESTPEHRAVRTDPALDRAWCHLRLGEEAPGLALAMVRLEVALHKKADPAAEFEVLATQSEWEPEAEIGHQSVPGLGDEAVYIPDGDALGGPRLVARDGAVVLGMTLGTVYFSPDNGEVDIKEPDIHDVQALMAADLKALMAELKK